MSGDEIRFGSKENELNNQIELICSFGEFGAHLDEFEEDIILAFLMEWNRGDASKISCP